MMEAISVKLEVLVLCPRANPGIKASGAEAFRLYDLNLLAFVLNKFDFWGPKCPNYENIEF